MGIHNRILLPLLPSLLPILLQQAPPADAQGSGLMPNPFGRFYSWPFQCQAPIPLGQPCTDDFDCASPDQHCHLSKRVCARGQPAGAPCNGGNGACRG